MKNIFLILFLISGSAFGQSDYPNKPIRLVVGFAAGGISDVLARAIVMQRLPKRQRRLVELVYAADCDEVVTEAVYDAEQRAESAAIRAAQGLGPDD
jgi:hypothetical protein